LLYNETLMIYSTSIRDDNSTDSFEADISFTIIKRVDCKNTKLKDIYINKLDRLKKENFNRIKIPNFDYSIDGNVICCVIDFIKGTYINTSEQRNIVYEDIVCHKSDWTFSDYHDANFILQEGTGDIFSIDFQSYRFHPDKEKRKISWSTYLDDQNLD
tara:strand:+ start:811 stop:1284 length:474 start_codon:yes stop_codon:yes gene_type:complete